MIKITKTEIYGWEAAIRGMQGDQPMKEQIEEMFNIIVDGIIDGEDNNGVPTGNTCADIAEALYNAGYRKQKEGEWEWFEEWNPSTPEHPIECDDCGWRCAKCKTALADEVGGYWDDPLEKPQLSFCPNCGAKMKGGAE